MHPLLHSIYEKSEVHDATGNAVNPFPAATPEDVAHALHQLVLSKGCERTLEVGMAYGLSTLAICSAHAKRGLGSHIAMDPRQDAAWKNIGLLNAERAGFRKMLRFVEAPSYVALPGFLAEGVSIDFAFIDGSHLFDNAFLDFFYVDKMLDEGGYIVFDDIWMPGVRRVASFAVTNLNYEVLEAPCGDPFYIRLGRVARRFAQEPLRGDAAGIWRIGAKICLLRKRRLEKRLWDFHRTF